MKDQRDPSNYVDKNTNPLDASFEAETEQEKLLCRHLVTSIQDRNPYPRKLYESGEATNCLSEKSLRALDEVLRNAAQYEARLRVKRILELDEQENEAKKRDKGKGGWRRKSLICRECGVKILDKVSEEGKEKEEVCMGKRVIVFGLLCADGCQMKGAGQRKGAGQMKGGGGVHMAEMKAGDDVDMAQYGGQMMVEYVGITKEIVVEGEDGVFTRLGLPKNRITI